MLSGRGCRVHPLVLLRMRRNQGSSPGVREAALPLSFPCPSLSGQLASPSKPRGRRWTVTALLLSAHRSQDCCGGARERGLPPEAERGSGPVTCSRLHQRQLWSCSSAARLAPAGLCGVQREGLVLQI